MVQDAGGRSGAGRRRWIARLKILTRFILACASLLLIGYGAWRAWPPLGFVLPGALIWLDLTVGGLLDRLRAGDAGWQRRSRSR